MNEVTLIGLGAMGSAIGRSLLENNYRLTIWNRSSGRDLPLLELGANSASSLADAVNASTTVILCINEYSAARSLLDDREVLPLLEDRTIIQLSTGTPGEAREMEQWLLQRKAHYLDGSIMVYPESIGTAQGQILVSGSEEIFSKNRSFIDSLGGDVRYLGDKIGAAAALDMAVVTRLATITVAVIHGANVCLSEGVSLKQFADMFPQGDRAHSLAMKIHRQEFDKNISATVDVSISVISSIKRQAKDLGINHELPSLLLDLYKRAQSAGLGKFDNASLIKVLQGSC